MVPLFYGGKGAPVVHKGVSVKMTDPAYVCNLRKHHIMSSLRPLSPSPVSLAGSTGALGSKHSLFPVEQSHVDVAEAKQGFQGQEEQPGARQQ